MIRVWKHRASVTTGSRKWAWRWAKSAQNRSPRDVCRLEVSELLLLWCHADVCQKTSRNGEAAVSNCAVTRSSSPPTALTKSMMGNDWLTTPLLLIGSDNRDVAFSAKMFNFFIWFHVIVYLNYAWIYPNIMTVRSLCEICDCCHIKKILK